MHLVIQIKACQFLFRDYTMLSKRFLSFLSQWRISCVTEIRVCFSSAETSFDTNLTNIHNSSVIMDRTKQYLICNSPQCCKYLRCFSHCCRWLQAVHHYRYFRPSSKWLNNSFPVVLPIHSSLHTLCATLRRPLCKYHQNKMFCRDQCGDQRLHTLFWSCKEENCTRTLKLRKSQGRSISNRLHLL